MIFIFCKKIQFEYFIVLKLFFKNFPRTGIVIFFPFSTAMFTRVFLVFVKYKNFQVRIYDSEFKILNH